MSLQDTPGTAGGDATIFALASAPGRAGIAVFRLSGGLSGPALASLAGKPLPAPRHAMRARIRHPKSGEVIDDGLALWFPAPHSFTGEDVVELHLHGGRAVAEALAEMLLGLGLRPAERGEFSRRAVLAGKLDLTRAEAIADLVQADTEAQRRQARRQLDGALADATEAWRARMVRLRAHLEAEIDFSEEELPEGLTEAARAGIALLADEMTGILADKRRGERLRHGLQVALIGAPNVGKSSLLNRIAGRDAAIVSATPGTTRDIIEIHLDLGGYPVTLSDTAGLREAEGDIEAEGIRRSLARAQEADLRLLVLDCSDLPESLSDGPCADLSGDTHLVVNKSDLAYVPAAIEGRTPFGVSAQTGAGIGELLAFLTVKAREALEGSGPIALTRARYRAAITEAEAALRHALNATLPELAAEDVRVATDALGRITGRVDVEEMLDVIFGEFCIGK